MLTWRGLDEVPAAPGPTVVTIGTFDGVHRGHRHVIDRAREVASGQPGSLVVAVTFDPHPLQVLVPDKAPPLLATLPDRLGLLEQAGVDATLVLPFTAELAAMEPANFANDILFDRLHAVAIVVGENFRFGRRATGDVTLLRTLAEARGIQVDGLGLDGSDEVVWSSSYVRQRLEDGDVQAASDALGRPFSLHGVVVRGHQRGRELLGYPTANIPVWAAGTAVPSDGVYAGWLRRLDAQSEGYQAAAISVGTNPTFEGVQRTVEAYVLDRDDLELYDVEVEIVFAERLRGMVKFDSIEALVTQMDADVVRARDLLTVTAPPGEGSDRTVASSSGPSLTGGE